MGRLSKLLYQKETTLRRQLNKFIKKNKLDMNLLHLLSQQIHLRLQSMIIEKQKQENISRLANELSEISFNKDGSFKISILNILI